MLLIASNECRILHVDTLLSEYVSTIFMIVAGDQKGVIRGGLLFSLSHSLLCCLLYLSVNLMDLCLRISAELEMYIVQVFFCYIGKSRRRNLQWGFQLRVAVVSFTNKTAVIAWIHD